MAEKFERETTNDKYFETLDRDEMNGIYKEISRLQKLAHQYDLYRADRDNDNDSEYWQGLKDDYIGTDPLSGALSILRTIEMYEDLFNMIFKRIPRSIKLLEADRNLLIDQASARFSDICQMVDAVKDEGEGIYEATVRITEAQGAKQ